MSPTDPAATIVVPAPTSSPSDAALLELVRGGRVHAMPPADAAVSVIVIAADPGRLAANAVADALAQTRRVAQVIVVGPPRDAAVWQRMHEVSGHAGRVTVLSVARPGVAPAATRARRGVRQAQYLRAAMPFVTGDWVTACPDDRALPHDFVAAALTRAQRETLEVVWLDDEATFADRGFADVVWAASCTALPPAERAGWDGVAADAAWWSRLAAAGFRMPGASALERAVARKGR
jgi:hypothetical protein